MNRQTVAVVVIMAVLAGSTSIADAATVTTQQQPHISGAAAGKMILTALEKAEVTPPPAIAKALHSVNRQYCLMDAESQGRMQHRLAILGIKTKIRTGIQWPLVMYYHRVCAPTKADLHIYEEAHYPIVQAIRHHHHAPVWNLHQAYRYCTKREGVKAASPAMPWQMEQVFNGCLTPKK